MSGHVQRSATIYVYIEQTNNDSYQAPMVLLEQLEKLLKPHSAITKVFEQEVVVLADTYKRKRNMLALLKHRYSWL